MSGSASSLSASKHMMTPIKKSKSSKNVESATSEVMISRPDPQVLFSPSGKSRLGREEMMKRYDEWLKIASENVKFSTL
jgi:hypothetical protein